MSLIKTSNRLFIDNDVKGYMNSLKRFNPLRKEEERKLMHDYKTNNSISSRNKLITSNLKYACKLANQYRNYGVPLSYLISEANNALIYAIEKFDEKNDVKLISYAKWWIIQRIKSCISGDKIIEEELPNEFCENNYDYNDENKNDDYCDLGVFIDKEDGDNTFGYDIKTIINSLIEVLNVRENDIIKMRFGIEPYEKEYTLEEIANKYGKSKERIRQILDDVMTKLRSEVMIRNIDENIIYKF